jgi:putative DNA primase/helicase
MTETAKQLKVVGAKRRNGAKRRKAFNALSIETPEGRTDVANGRRFKEQYGDKVRFCHPWRKWLIWDGTRWKIDDTGKAENLAASLSDVLWVDARRCNEPQALAFAARSADNGHVKATLAQAKSQPGIPVLPAELDSDPWLFNCPNGTIDLRSGNQRDHSRNDLISKLCPTNYNGEASSWHWDRFQESISDGRQDLMDFKQRFFGYSITGDVREQTLHIHHGTGSNGKSVELNAFMETVGADYAMKAPPDLLIAKRNETHPTERADLFGKRFVAAIETGDGQRLDETLVKELTGGDPIRARRMREDFWEFQPSHKVVMCSNHKPRVKGTDNAIWRRLRLVPYDVTFWNPDDGYGGPDELRQDKTLAEKLRAEAEGILRWCVRGCIEWQSSGLGMPDSVSTATADYRDGEDIIGRFLADNCEHGGKVRFAVLYEQLKEWCDEGGDNLPSRKAVAQYLVHNGYEKQPGGVRWYHGLTLR